MIKHITVIPEDKIILLGGEGLSFDFAAPAEMHALQWHDGVGHIEYRDGSPNRLLAVEDYAAEVAPYVELWRAEAARLAAEAARPPTLEEARAAKLDEINAAFESARADGRLMSSLGFEINAGERAARDVEGLIAVLENAGEEQTMFRDYQNLMRPLSLDGLKTLRLEIMAYIQAAYARKWALCGKIETTQNLEELQAVAWIN